MWNKSLDMTNFFEWHGLMFQVLGRKLCLLRLEGHHTCI
jgi:hypothetical protein